MEPYTGAPLPIGCPPLVIVNVIVIVIVVIFGITMMVGNSGASAPGSFLQGCYVGSGRRVEALR